MIQFLKSYNSELVFDGMRQGSIEIIISIENTAVRVNVDNSYYISGLREIISDFSFQEVIAQTNNAIESSTFPGNYSGTDKLPLRYCVAEELIVLISFGEFQPSRYKVYIESLWKIRGNCENRRNDD